MAGLIDDADYYRAGNVGVMKVLKEHSVIEQVGAKKTGYWKALKLR